MLCFFLNMMQGLYNNLQECFFELEEARCTQQWQAGVACFCKFSKNYLVELFTSDWIIEFAYYDVFACTMKRQDVCKRYGFLDSVSNKASEPFFSTFIG